MYDAEGRHIANFTSYDNIIVSGTPNEIIQHERGQMQTKLANEYHGGKSSVVTASRQLNSKT